MVLPAGAAGAGATLVSSFASAARQYATPLAVQCYKEVCEALRPPVLSPLFPPPNSMSVPVSMAQLQECQSVIGARCEDVRGCLRREELGAAFEAIQSLTCAVLDSLTSRADAGGIDENILRPLACTWTALLRAFKLSRQLARFDFSPARTCLETLNQTLLRHHISALNVAVEYLRKLLGAETGGSAESMTGVMCGVFPAPSM